MHVGKDIGPFRIQSELGNGAMGSVYGAVRRDSGKLVAIKVISYGLLGNETAVKRFEREADILKNLKHPNIVRYIGTGSIKKTPFFIMEFVEGESLDKVLNRRGPFPWDEVVVLGRQLCSALRHAHEKGIIHRDLKPSNLMILRDGTLKLTDFGIAKDADLTALTGANCTVGTAAYMSPEQCRGEKTLSAKSDLYSMGVVFYELLTGRKPFQAESPIEMFQAHVSAKFERPSRFVMDIPVWLDSLVCNLLEKKPEHRPFDAEMVIKVLDEIEQKVSELRSAGVDAATAKTTDRSRNRPTDETDRDAARTLRSAVNKKKMRRKVVPFAQRKWVQAALLSTALIGLGGIVYAFTRPPSADKLFAATKAAAESKDYQTALDEAAKYLRLYGNQDGERADQVRELERSLRTDRCERQLHNRLYGKLKHKPDGEAEKIAFDAMKREDAGDEKGAAETWQLLKAKASESGDPEDAVYADLAQKKVANLSALPKYERILADALDDEHAFYPTGSQSQLSAAGHSCLKAERFESFGDLFAARSHWQAAAEEYLKSLDDRSWGILAAVRARKLETAAAGAADKEKEERLALLNKKLADADRVSEAADGNDRRRALSDCRDIVALYGSDSDAKVVACVKKAKRLLADRNWVRQEK